MHRLQYATRLPFLYPCSAPTHRRAMMSALSHSPDLHSATKPSKPLASTPELPDSPPIVIPSPKSLSSDAASPQTVARPPPAPKVEKPRPQLKATKAAITIVRLISILYPYPSHSLQTSEAVLRLKALLTSPTPQLIRIGVRNKGCAGLSYHLDYVEKPEKFDEVVEQDGVRVLIDSKALFSIIGSEMDWKEDPLRYVALSPFSCIQLDEIPTARNSYSRTLISRTLVDVASRSVLDHDPQSYPLLSSLPCATNVLAAYLTPLHMYR
jgi:iron-sulfur cluster assembly accessory protein